MVKDDAKLSLNQAYQLIKGEDVLLQQLAKLMRENRARGWESTSEIQKKFSDLRKLLIFTSLQEGKRITPWGSRKIEHLLTKYGEENAAQTIAVLADEINETYNRRDTEMNRWVDLKVQFLKYKALKQQELIELQEFSDLAENLGATYTVQRVKRVYGELIAETKELSDQLEKFEPVGKETKGSTAFFDPYVVMSRVIQRKSDAYRCGARTEFLKAYQQLVRDSDGSPAQIASQVGSIEQYLRGREKNPREHLSTARQTTHFDRERKRIEPEREM